MQDQLAVREQLEFSCFELLLRVDAGSWGGGHFVNPEGAERLSLQAATKKQQWRRGSGH
jgi:hypothetical protein